jgi:hypothetical protein
MVKHWMTCHQELQQAPDFSFKILGSFKDCLSRQVTEAIKINNSVDFLLNSKNEYLANCLARVTVSEDSLERKKRERNEELEEVEEMKKLEAFRTEKRKNLPARRKEVQGQAENNQPDGRSILDALKKKRRNDLELESRSKRRRLETGNDEVDIGLFLKTAEERCLRAGQLSNYLRLDKLRMLRRMECLGMDRILADLPAWWNMHGMQDQDTPYQIKTATPDECSTGKVVAEKAGKTSGNKNNVPIYKLVGLTGWWRRQEKEGLKEEKLRKKDEDALKVTNDRKEKEKEGRKDFIRKFFPTFSESPGGTQRLSGTKPRTPVRFDRKNCEGTFMENLPLSGGKRKQQERGHLFDTCSKKMKHAGTFKQKLNFWGESDSTLTILKSAHKENPGHSHLAGPSSKSTAEPVIWRGLDRLGRGENN